MSPEDAATFVEIMASRDNSVALIVTALKAAGYPASRGSLARHRRGECKPVH
jgi:hypothetical protein